MTSHFIEENDNKEATYSGGGDYLLLHPFENMNFNIADHLTSLQHIMTRN